MIGAMLVYGLEPIGDNLLAGLRALAGMVFNKRPPRSWASGTSLPSRPRPC